MPSGTPKSKPDLSSVRAELARMLAAGETNRVLELVVGLLEQMATQNNQLEWRLQAALRQLYRKKSEKVSLEQLTLFLAQLTSEQKTQANVETVATPEPPASSPSVSPAAPAPSPRRIPRGRKPLPETLRREVRLVAVPDDKRTCDVCGKRKEPMGYDVRETLEFRPAEFFVIEERLEKCACKTCQEGVVMAEASPKPIDGARPGPGLLAQIVTSKFDDSCPLYRQSKIYARSGIDLSPSLLGDWCAATADMLEPLWKLSRTMLLASYLISVDDTGLPVLDREHENGIKRGHLWTYIGDQSRVAYCEYTPNWKGSAPQSLLDSFQGYIQGDGYAGFDKIFDGPDPPTRVGCMAHCRRKFVAAMEAGDARAAIAVALFRQLYAVEAQAKLEALGPDQLKDRRQQLSKPIMMQLGRVVADLHNGSVPKSPLGKATIYAVNQWTTLLVFLEDGRLPIDNTHVEREQRLTALGRKNFLFAGSDEGARRLAVLMTVITNCKLAKVCVFDYLRDLLAKLAAGWPASKLTELMPAAWAANHQRQQPPAGQIQAAAS